MGTLSVDRPLKGRNEFSFTVAVLVWTQLVFHFMEMRKQWEISCLILFPPSSFSRRGHRAAGLLLFLTLYLCRLAWHQSWDLWCPVWPKAWHGNTVLCNWFSNVWNGVLVLFLFVVYIEYELCAQNTMTITFASMQQCTMQCIPQCSVLDLTF